MYDDKPKEIGEFGGCYGGVDMVVKVFYDKTKTKDDIGICFAPIDKDPNAGKMIWVNHIKKTATYEDGSPFKPHKSRYKAAFVVTGYKDYKQFIDEAGVKVIERIKERLSKMNKVSRFYATKKVKGAERMPFGKSKRK